MQHLQQQAFQAGAAFPPRQLEVLVLMMRSDAVHALGGACRCLGSQAAARGWRAMLPRLPEVAAPA